MGVALRCERSVDGLDAVCEICFGNVERFCCIIQAAFQALEFRLERCMRVVREVSR